MKLIVDLLKEKGQHVWCVSPTDSVLVAIKRMAEREIGALAVTDQGRLEGIFSERDYTRKIILRGRPAATTTVGEVMTTKVAVVDPMKTVEECMALMTHMHVRHLPVMADGKLVGMISIGDLVKSIIAEQRFVIEQLESYIYGTPWPQ
jgi:CBS domain-containing protein